MDIGKAFTYVFEDPNWIMKVLIGGLLMLIPIIGQIVVVGYMLNTLKNVADGQPQPLPEWGEFGNHFMKGLYAFVGALIYFAPLIVLVCCMWILALVGGTGASATGGDTGGAIGGIVGIVILCFQCLIGLYALFAGLTLWAPLTRFAMSANQLSIFWDFRSNFDFIMKNIANYIIALLLGWVASFIAGFGIILCFVGVLFTSFWANLVTAYLFGQLWRQSQAQGTAPAMA
jgi:hypothetical protein